MKALNALATLGVAAHNATERWNGVGVVFEPFLGRTGTNILWSVVHPLALVGALVDPPAAGPALAFNAGVAVAGAGVHFVAWPWSRKFGVLPWLDEAEGMPRSALPAYNTILWLWMAGGIGSILRETERRNLRWAAAGVATAPLLLISARHHFAWARRRAEQGDPHFSHLLLEDAGAQEPAAREA